MPHAIADGYERWADTGDQSVMELFSPNFYDNVSGQSGLAIFDVVAGWLEQSFTERRVEHHATMSDDDRVMVWLPNTDVTSATDSRACASVPSALRSPASQEGQQVSSRPPRVWSQFWSPELASDPDKPPHGRRGLEPVREHAASPFQGADQR